MNHQFQPNPYLSKSLFIRGLQCYKSLYLEKYRRELKPDTPKSIEMTMKSGQEVGELARDIYPGGILIPYDDVTKEEQLAMTLEAMKSDAQSIYEAAFRYDDIFVKVDILKRTKNGWELCEVKASTEKKPYHLDDITLQYYVLLGAGVHLSGANLIHVNNSYVRKVDIEPEKLFSKVDVMLEVQEKLPSVAEKILKMRHMLAGDIPDIDIGKQCSDPYECDFVGYCWRHIPENSIFSLRGRGIDKYDFYRRGITDLADIPLEILNRGQRMQVEGFIEKKVFFDKEGVKDFLESLWYPLYFLDFETFMTAIPPYDGMSPYQQMPFQYSLYVQKREDAPMEYYEYLAQPNADPRRELIEKLLHEIPQGSCGLAYNSSFEVSRLNELAVWFPEYMDAIAEITQNIIDLAAPFRSKHVYSWEMGGSYSQKAVLPALVPELSYDGMEVADGGMAMDAYFQMCTSEDQDEINRIRKALLEYCKLDTLGMVKILEKLKMIVLQD